MSETPPSPPVRSAAPASARDALIAELLGDVGVLQESINQLKKDLPAIGVAVSGLVADALEKSAKRGAQVLHQALINPPALDLGDGVKSAASNLHNTINSASNELIVRMQGTMGDQAAQVKNLLKQLDERLVATERQAAAARRSMWISIAVTTVSLLAVVSCFYVLFKPLVASWIH